MVADFLWDLEVAIIIRQLEYHTPFMFVLPVLEFAPL